MRLGELKKIIDDASVGGKIVFENESLYGGQRFLIKNYSILIKALTHLAEQEWVTTDKSIVKQLNDNINAQSFEAQLSPEEFSRLNQLIDEINSKLPIFFGIISNMVEPQPSEVINVKLPSKTIKDFKDLNKFNEDLQEVLNLVVKFKGLRGDIKLIGFDVGSEWYTILIVGGPLVYGALMSCIKIAEKLINLRKMWYESEDVKLGLEIKRQDLGELKRNSAPTNKPPAPEEDLKNYIERMFEMTLNKKVSELIETLSEANLNNPTEMQISISKGIKKLVILLEKGTEIHPSLNPPQYILVDQKSFSIDYQELRNVFAAANHTAQIPHNPSTE